MERDSFEDRVGVIAALDHPLTRRAYGLVVEGGWVSRDAAAQALGVARSVAAFHLDKLIEAGLLEARFERTSGRTGPGAGRTAKLYGRSAREVDLSLPPRRYDLAGAVLADALTAAATGEGPVEQALAHVARNTGERIGVEARQRRGRSAPRTALMDALSEHGYEPQRKDGGVTLRNCPFHALVGRHPELVCQMNLDLLTGVLDGLDCSEKLCARLEPAAGRCCVHIHPR